ncbi:hypothetical protein FRC10_004838, partial [Ceratobasidium sp. 414]
KERRVATSDPTAKARNSVRFVDREPDEWNVCDHLSTSLDDKGITPRVVYIHYDCRVIQYLLHEFGCFGWEEEVFESWKKSGEGQELISPLSQTMMLPRSLM